MRILITRPRDDSELLSQKLKERGHDVQVEPLLEIRPVPNAMLDLQGVQAILLTSANGARCFAALATGLRRDAPIFAVGDTTAAAARKAGFTQVASAGGGVADLAKLVQARLKPQNGALLYASGRDIAGDLPAALQPAGFQVRRVITYTAEPTQALSPTTAAAFKARQVDLAVFFSARTAANFARLVRDAGLGPALEKTVALGISPAVLEPVLDLGWAMLEAARQPQESDLIRAIARHKIIGQLAGPDALDREENGIKDGEPDSFRRRVGDEPPRPAKPPARWTTSLAAAAAVLALGALGVAMMEASRPAPDISSAATLRLDTRLAALERQATARAQQAAPAATPAADPRVDALQRRVTELEQALVDARRPPQTAPSDPRIDDMQHRIAELTQALTAAQAQAQSAQQTAQMAAQQAAAPRGTSREALAPVVVQLAAAAAKGEDFVASLAMLRALSGDDAALAKSLDRLQSFAAATPPPVDALVRRFRALRADAASRSRAAAAPAAASDSVSGETWLDAVLKRAGALVTVRRIEDAPPLDAVAARLAQADDLVGGRNLGAAIAQLEQLDTAARTPFAAWIEDARARVALDRATADLTQAAAAAPPS